MLPQQTDIVQRNEYGQNQKADQKSIADFFKEIAPGPIEGIMIDDIPNEKTAYPYQQQQYTDMQKLLAHSPLIIGTGKFFQNIEIKKSY
jgi:hypothetical protein